MPLKKPPFYCVTLFQGSRLNITANKAASTTVKSAMTTIYRPSRAPTAPAMSRFRTARGILRKVRTPRTSATRPKAPDAANTTHLYTLKGSIYASSSSRGTGVRGHP